MARSQGAQMKAVAAIVQSWQWRKVTVIYEDTASSINGIFPHLIDALQELEVDVDYYLPLQAFPPCSVHEKLGDLRRRQSRVFIVHTSSELAINVFMEAKRLRMMKKEFVWITTESISNFIGSFNSSTISVMQGVLGVMGFSAFHGQMQYKNFSKRFKAKFQSVYPTQKYVEPGNSALNAYDAVYTAVLAIEGKQNPKSLAYNLINNTSVDGQKLLARILESKFIGLSGEVIFKGGTLAPSTIFQIVNVIGKSSLKLGFWSEGLGFSMKIDKGSRYSKSMNILGQVNWPGRASTVPRGWAVATKTNRLRIGVPGHNTFKGFVNVTYEHPGGQPIVTGLSIDVFKAVVRSLPYNLLYDFFPYNGTYDSLVQEISLTTFDAVVGDTTIVANRCAYAEFSQPYSDSGLQLLLYTKSKTSATRAWLFMKPFSTSTWISTAVVNLYSGFVVWYIERQTNRDFEGSWLKQCGTIIWLAFTTLFTSLQGDKLHSNLSRMAAVVWLFVALALTSSYTASLTSLLTIQNLDLPVTNVETLRRTGAKVGCNGNSFVVKYLEKVLKFEPQNIEKIYVEDNYPEALKSGKIAAAFLEVPYIKVLLAKNCNGYTAGESFKVGGFGFVFPKGDPLLSDISQGVLDVSESGTLLTLENSMLKSYKCSQSEDDVDYSLGFDSFWGLFAITAGASTLALLLYLFPCGIPKWPIFSSKVFIETESEHEMHNLPATYVSPQHDPDQDENGLFRAEMKNR
ncbi:glutamate receptor 2.2-like [Apium graveolens]|uniref:glutamate receptor 2.2-like n=1 Tax=Apium graveolens TaxID=4045 RepID=UPI003D7B3432